MTRKKKQHLDIYQSITNQIIAAIEVGTSEAQMPWHRSGFTQTRPVNISSTKPYQGINILSLWAAAMSGNYEHGLWGTYRQWQEAGAQVRKGEKSSFIVFYKQFENDETENNENQSERRLFMARASRVFNVAQVDGYELPDQPEPTENLVNRIASVEEFIARTGAIIKEGGEQACYNPATDQITMPDQHRFFDTNTGSATEHYHSVLLHELIHWTGAKHRLNRTFGKRFGDHAYAIEELTAELGAAFLCADLEISASPREDHACYINNWLSAMKADAKAVFAAASAASKATEYLNTKGPG
ncbi:ArdC family protein [Parasphingorhabdus sp.]|uniref:ArdC family protein n=1 Tax=Parasphingorhabdus sp. TaxID=2709688 RepID=UPI003BAE252F